MALICLVFSCNSRKLVDPVSPEAELALDALLVCRACRERQTTSSRLRTFPEVVTSRVRVQNLIYDQGSTVKLQRSCFRAGNALPSNDAKLKLDQIIYEMPAEIAKVLPRAIEHLPQGAINRERNLRRSLAFRGLSCGGQKFHR
jgi:hypothetical protein